MIMTIVVLDGLGRMLNEVVSMFLNIRARVLDLLLTGHAVDSWTWK